MYTDDFVVVNSFARETSNRFSVSALKAVNFIHLLTRSQLLRHSSRQLAYMVLQFPQYVLWIIYIYQTTFHFSSLMRLAVHPLRASYAVLHALLRGMPFKMLVSASFFTLFNVYVIAAQWLLIYFIVASNICTPSLAKWSIWKLYIGIL